MNDIKECYIIKNRNQVWDHFDDRAKYYDPDLFEISGPYQCSLYEEDHYHGSGSFTMCHIKDFRVMDWMKTAFPTKEEARKYLTNYFAAKIQETEKELQKLKSITIKDSCK